MLFRYVGCLLNHWILKIQEYLFPVFFHIREQYVHINGIEKYRPLLKDSITGSFVEDILEDLEEETIVNFMINALSRFIIGMLLIMNMGEVPSGEKSSRDVDILLNSVYGAFLSRM